MEELQERDVLWAEEAEEEINHRRVPPSGQLEARLSLCAGMITNETAPVSIPTPASASHRRRRHKPEFPRLDEKDNNGGEENEGDTSMVPPHVLVARRLSGKMVFSVYTGQGRTLKGRDLSQVRNSILRLTGFIEAYDE